MIADADDLALVGASLAIPPFTRGKPQLSQREVETSRALSQVHIHVECAIGRMKNFKILQSTLPIKLIKRPREADYATIDKILVVCAALCNLYPILILMLIKKMKFILLEVLCIHIHDLNVFALFTVP